MMLFLAMSNNVNAHQAYWCAVIKSEEVNKAWRHGGVEVFIEIITAQVLIVVESLSICWANEHVPNVLGLALQSPLQIVQAGNADKHDEKLNSYGNCRRMLANINMSFQSSAKNPGTADNPTALLDYLKSLGCT